MTPLRQAMLRDMELRGFSKTTKEAYIRHVKNLAQHFGKSPEPCSQEQVLYQSELHPVMAELTGVEPA